MNEQQQQNSRFLFVRSRTDFFDDVAEMLYFLSLVYSFNHFNNNNTSNSAVSLIYIL